MHRVWIFWHLAIALVMNMCTVQGVSPSSSSHSNHHDAGHRGAPGVGVRLNSRQLRGRTSLSQVNDRERVKLDKFTSLLSAANVNLGLFCMQPPAWWFSVLTSL